MNIVDFFESKNLLNDIEAKELAKCIRRKKIPKKELILSIENTSKQLYFIEQGIARVFYNKKEKDVTLYFLQENMIGLPIESIFYHNICKFGIEALSETKVAMIDYEQWINIISNNAPMQEFIYRGMIDYIKKSNDRIYNLKFQTPKERYEAFLLEMPDNLSDIPLGNIASYLGMTQETLSRLRNKK